MRSLKLRQHYPVFAVFFLCLLGTRPVAAQTQTVLPQPLTIEQMADICVAIGLTNTEEEKHLLKLKNNNPPQIMSICMKKKRHAVTCANGPGLTFSKSNKCQVIKLNSKHWNDAQSKWEFAGGKVSYLEDIALAALLAHESLHTGQEFKLVQGTTKVWGVDAENDRDYANGEINAGARQIELIKEQFADLDLQDLIEAIELYMDTFRERAK